MKPATFVLSTSTQSSKFLGKTAVMMLSNSGVDKGGSRQAANIISASGIRTINFTKDELPGPWDSATKLNRRDLDGR